MNFGRRARTVKYEEVGERGGVFAWDFGGGCRCLVRGDTQCGNGKWGNLDLFGAPSCIRFSVCEEVVSYGSFSYAPWWMALRCICRSSPHVRGWFDARDKLQRTVCDSNNPNDRSEDLVQEPLIEKDGANEDVENAAAEEREEERRVARNLRGDLKFEKGSSCLIGR